MATSRYGMRRGTPMATPRLFPYQYIIVPDVTATVGWLREPYFPRAVVPTSRSPCGFTTLPVVKQASQTSSEFGK